jgi:hypothetical protein
MDQQQGHVPRPRPIRDVRTPATVTLTKKRGSKLGKLKSFNLINPRLKLLVVIVLLLLAGLFIRNYIQTRNELRQDEGARLSAQISKFLELPSDETPTLATVKDASKLKSQPFFKNAQDGDKALIYSRASKAVLYRPSTKKVVEYTTISLGNPNNTNQ